MEAQRTVHNISSSSSLLISMVTIECQWNVSDRERVLLGGHYQLVHPMLLQGRAQSGWSTLKECIAYIQNTAHCSRTAPIYILAAEATSDCV